MRIKEGWRYIPHPIAISRFWFLAMSAMFCILDPDSPRVFRGDFADMGGAETAARPLANSLRKAPRRVTL